MLFSRQVKLGKCQYNNMWKKEENEKVNGTGIKMPEQKCCLTEIRKRGYRARYNQVMISTPQKGGSGCEKYKC